MKLLRTPLIAALLALAVVAVAACQPTTLASVGSSGNPSGRSGIWISRSEVLALPTSGPAWDGMRAASASKWGTPTIADQNSDHDVKTLAGALVAVRLGDDRLAAKVREHLMTLARNHPYDRVLALARELPSYVIAADLVGLNDGDRRVFSAFLREAATHDMAGHSGGVDLRSTALRSANNWGTMSRAAMAAIAVYLGDAGELAVVADTHEAWLGGSAPNQLQYSSTSWHVGSPVGINRRGASRNGHPMGGVIAEDQRRTGDYTWPAPKGTYPMEAMQGAVVTSVILHRAGVLPFNAGDSALIRATSWLTDVNNNPASGDDRNTLWLLNKYGKSGFRTSAASPAKNIAWADWTASR